MKKLLLSHLLLLFLYFSVYSQYNYIDGYIGNPVTMVEIGNSSNLVNQPRDLDFKPNSNELWVMNNGTFNGGSMVIFYNAGKIGQSSEYRKDSHSSHFMIFPSAFAFGEEGNWANINEIKSTGSSTSTFMGPALWTADTNIFARVFQNNWTGTQPLGSHLDMLHQSPFGMGIAHDSANAYWVADGHNGNICLYDFNDHHGPGYEDHSDGKIWRYTDVTFTRAPQFPSHMILDKNSGWLYFIDGGPQKVKRMNTNTGNVIGNLSVPSTAPEQLAGYWEVTGATVEELTTLSAQPTGIDYYKDRLIVSDYSGHIYIYNTSGTFNLLDSINTGNTGLMGIKIGPDGHIWCVNYLQSKVYRLDHPGIPANDVSIEEIAGPLVENFYAGFYSTAFNNCSSNVSPQILIRNNGTNTVSSVETEYTLDGNNPVNYTWTGNLAAGSDITVTLPSSVTPAGRHMLEAKILTVNGIPDDIDLNNKLTGSFRAIEAPQTLPFAEGFEATTFPPSGWDYINYNPHNKMMRVPTGAFGASSGSIRMDNYSGGVDITGQIDYLISPIIDMSNASPNTWMSINVAYAKYNSASNDKLEVMASSDCGNTWDIIYSKTGTTLSTAPNTTLLYVPNTWDWRKDSVNLGTYAGASEVLFLIATESNAGNNVYLDDFVISDFGTGIISISEEKFQLFPNPATDAAIISLNDNVDQLQLKIYSSEGSLIKNIKLSGIEKSYTIDLREMKKGIYFLEMTTSKSTYRGKLIKN